jgi:hypothetical protein
MANNEMHGVCRRCCSCLVLSFVALVWLSRWSCGAAKILQQDIPCTKEISNANKKYIGP